MSEATAPRRFMLWLVGMFSAIAVALAAVGIYGVVAESVAQRVPEIGLRMALGATAGSVLRLILGQAGWLIAAGLALGLTVAFATSSAMSAFVFGVRTTDPASYAAATASIVAASLAGCTLPARRAARVDPVIALRTE